MIRNTDNALPFINAKFYKISTFMVRSYLFAFMNDKNCVMKKVLPDDFITKVTRLSLSIVHVTKK